MDDYNLESILLDQSRQRQRAQDLKYQEIVEVVKQLEKARDEAIKRRQGE